MYKYGEGRNFLHQGIQILDAPLIPFVCYTHIIYLSDTFQVTSFADSKFKFSNDEDTKTNPKSYYLMA